ncbi:heme-binding protein [Streptomyces sp. B6B3]|uniref:heme-binding protein n=1 Tax=Streptomyces sp. B6B3 TaxID=3153570 RepID=UPI00325F457F
MDPPTGTGARPPRLRPRDRLRGTPVAPGGGLPLTDPATGHVLGAVGVSGGTADQDVHVAAACARALPD